MIRACAGVHSVSTRAVRAWREKGDPRWSEFVRERALAATQHQQQPLPLGGRPPSLSLADEEASAQARFLGLQRLADEAVQRGDAVGAERTLRAAGEAHRLLSAIRSTRLSHEAAAGQVAGEEIEKILGVTRAVAAMVHRLPDLLAADLNPAAPEVARAVLQRWIDGDFRRAVQQAINPQAHDLPRD